MFNRYERIINLDEVDSFIHIPTKPDKDGYYALQQLPDPKAQEVMVIVRDKTRPTSSGEFIFDPNLNLWLGELRDRQVKDLMSFGFTKTEAERMVDQNPKIDSLIEVLKEVPMFKEGGNSDDRRRFILCYRGLTTTVNKTRRRLKIWLKNNLGQHAYSYLVKY